MASKRAHLVTLRWIAVAMAGVEVVIHAVLVPSHLKETPYIGVLFIAATAILTVVLVCLLLPRARVAGWVVGAPTCAGMFVGFIVSRTIGLPDYNEAWTSDHGLGLISLPPELIFIGAALYAVRLRRLGLLLFRSESSSWKAARRSASHASDPARRLALPTDPRGQAGPGRNNRRRLRA